MIHKKTLSHQWYSNENELKSFPLIFIHRIPINIAHHLAKLTIIQSAKIVKHLVFRMSDEQHQLRLGWQSCGYGLALDFMAN